MSFRNEFSDVNWWFTNHWIFGGLCTELQIMWQRRNVQWMCSWYELPLFCATDSKRDCGTFCSQMVWIAPWIFGRLLCFKCALGCWCRWISVSFPQLHWNNGNIGQLMNWRTGNASHLSCDHPTHKFKDNCMGRIWNMCKKEKNSTAT